MAKRSKASSATSIRTRPGTVVFEPKDWVTERPGLGVDDNNTTDVLIFYSFGDNAARSDVAWLDVCRALIGAKLPSRAPDDFEVTPIWR